jgi:hypothetical protein
MARDTRTARIRLTSSRRRVSRYHPKVVRKTAKMNATMEPDATVLSSLELGYERCFRHYCPARRIDSGLSQKKYITVFCCSFNLDRF